MYLPIIHFRWLYQIPNAERNTNGPRCGLSSQRVWNFQTLKLKHTLPST